MNSRMTNIPKPSSDLTEIIEWAIGMIGAVIAWIYFINKYFKSKSEEKQEFIQNVVKETVKATMDGELKGIKDDIKELRDWRESDRNHIDEKFSKLMAEVKK